MFGRDDEGRATLGGSPVADLLAASGAGTPAYLYDLDAIAGAARDLDAGYGAAPHLVCYAMKANSAGPVLRVLAAAGCGADVVSGPELSVALACGIAPEAIVFSGVAKGAREIDLALGTGARGIYSIHAESLEEIDRIAARARALGRRARVSFRVNPSVEADTHAKIATGHDDAKFGIPRGDLSHALRAIARHPELSLVGLSSHVGSQLRTMAPYLDAARALLAAVREAEAALGPLEFVDTGGGFGVDYGEGCDVPPGDFAAAAVRLLHDEGLARLRMLSEPGRSLVAAHGILVAAVVQPKVSPSSGRRWLMIDAGMNDLMRPALYQARHRIEPITLVAGADVESWRVVGPICESSDDFGSFDLPASPPGHVVIRDAGAYGFTMANQYNGRALAAEVFVRGGAVVEVFPRSDDAAWIAGRSRGHAG